MRTEQGEEEGIFYVKVPDCCMDWIVSEMMEVRARVKMWSKLLEWSVRVVREDEKFRLEGV